MEALSATEVARRIHRIELLILGEKDELAQRMLLERNLAELARRVETRIEALERKLAEIAPVVDSAPWKQALDACAALEHRLTEAGAP